MLIVWDVALVAYSPKFFMAFFDTVAACYPWNLLCQRCKENNISIVLLHQQHPEMRVFPVFACAGYLWYRVSTPVARPALAGMEYVFTVEKVFLQA